jgi:glutamine---fructose-6-phosphate transaminase (isomerizing)
MCGIVGYLGPSKAAPVLLSELRCLEYRGYDSAGVAVIESDELVVLKAAGKLSNLESLLTDKKPSATVGIGHTRWATHGIPNDENAHPHTDCTGTIAVVHNGIIENYQALRAELTAAGHTLVSQTDTEVVSHLIEDEYKKCATECNGDALLIAIERAVKRLEGAYALGIVSQRHPERIYAVNHNYSLSVGLGEGESFLASDSVAVRQFTNKLIRLEQSEIAEITAAGARLFNFDGAFIDRQPIEVDMNPYIINKDGYRHFLLKEIHEQPISMRQTMGKYINHPDKPIDLRPTENGGGLFGNYGVNLTEKQLCSIERINIVACGTACYAGMAGKYILEEICGIPVDVEIASEVRGRKPLLNDKTLCIAVSQSGETADTLAAFSEAQAAGAMSLGITNRADSHLSRITDNLMVTECGIEVSVAATKSFTAQVACFYVLALYIAETRQLLPADEIYKLKQQLLLVPALQERILSQEKTIRQESIKYAEAHDMLFMGRGINYPVALEGALKLKEISYIHASGYAAGELKHGPIAVLDAKVPVVTIVVPGKVYEKTISNAQEAKARNAQMIAVAVEGDKTAEGIFDTIFTIPQVSELFSPLITVLPLQLMSYFIADYLGKDVDQPRNLAKSVTVE